MAGLGTSMSGCQVPPPPFALTSLPKHLLIALVINKEHLSEKKRSTAPQLPDTSASLTLTPRPSLHLVPPTVYGRRDEHPAVRAGSYRARAVRFTSWQLGYHVVEHHPPITRRPML